MLFFVSVNVVCNYLTKSTCRKVYKFVDDRIFMTSFVLDADCLIKLAKAQLLTVLAESFECTVTKTVLEEVLKGKEKLFEDAFAIEKLAASKKLKVVSVEQLRSDISSGKGEKSILTVLEKNKNVVVISDDRKFLSILERLKYSYVNSGDVIVLLYLSGKISKENALSNLNAIKSIISKKVFENALFNIKEGKVK